MTALAAALAVLCFAWGYVRGVHRGRDDGIRLAEAMVACGRWKVDAEAPYPDIDEMERRAPLMSFLIPE